MDHAAADADDRGSHERDHGRPKAPDDARYFGHLAVLDVDGAHEAEEDEGRQDEEAAGSDRASYAIHRVADVRGELLGLRPGEGHAKVEGVKKAALGYPAPLLDKLVVHDRDLPGRAAEADHPEL